MPAPKKPTFGSHKGRKLFKKMVEVFAFACDNPDAPRSQVYNEGMRLHLPADIIAGMLAVLFHKDGEPLSYVQSAEAFEDYIPYVFAGYVPVKDRLTFETSTQ